MFLIGQMGQSFQQVVLGEPDVHMQKSKVGPLPNNHIQNLTQSRLVT